MTDNIDRIDGCSTYTVTCFIFFTINDRVVESSIKCRKCDGNTYEGYAHLEEFEGFVDCLRCKDCRHSFVPENL